MLKCKLLQVTIAAGDPWQRAGWQLDAKQFARRQSKHKIGRAARCSSLSNSYAIDAS